MDTIARELNLPNEKARETLSWVAEKNEDGEIAGLAGLSTNEWNHGFAVNGTRLTTWCALDTLYLPPLLCQTVKIDSRDPVTQEVIRVTVNPDGLKTYSPPGALISIVIPQVAEKGLQSAEQIWNAFCSYSHYFTSEANARAWFAGKEIEPVFLTIQEGFELGARWFESIGKYA